MRWNIRISHLCVVHTSGKPSNPGTCLFPFDHGCAGWFCCYHVCLTKCQRHTFLGIYEFLERNIFNPIFFFFKFPKPLIWKDGCRNSLIKFIWVSELHVRITYHYRLIKPWKIHKRMKMYEQSKILSVFGENVVHVRQKVWGHTFFFFDKSKVIFK